MVIVDSPILFLPSIILVVVVVFLQAAILYNLKSRHVQNLPYTRTGDIVIACNPYQWLYDLYTPQMQQLYSRALVWHRDDDHGDPRANLPPHVYEASSLAYRGLAAEGEDQSILVSGESGAGKTETVKILMGNLASVQRGDTRISSSSKLSPTNSNNKDSNVNSNVIVQRVLDSNPLLEAFGNAKTLRNDNSSRFGKYIQLQFHGQTNTTLAQLSGKTVPPCSLAGSKCQVYLLEKSRVISHEPQERTFHIFYQLLAAPEDKKVAIWSGLADTDNESFDYVGYTETDTIEGQSDQERFQVTIESLALVGVTGDQLTTLWRTICIVLQLGNLEFGALENDEDQSEITSPEDLVALSDLMGIPANVLTTALTLRNVQARSEIFQVPLTAEKAKESTDAFAKEIYDKTFLWLVRTINDATCAERNYHSPNANAATAAAADFGIIGLLDIFGFETFQVNRFEQLCINYANEKLQQKFTQDIFRSVQTEYEFEGIALGEIMYDDNTDVLDLVEGRMGLLAFLNEECVRPKGCDKTFVFKAQSMNIDNPCLFQVKRAQECEFGINHYAGPVVYDATGFVSKNIDTLPSDLQECATLSTNSILAKELQKEEMMNSLQAPKSSTGKKRRPAKAAAAANPKTWNRRSSNIVADTVWTKFKNQLTSLMRQLTETRTRYIRCIKPNTQKKPLLMEHTSTIAQLRCAGVVAAVTISRSAFPNRLDHEVVLARFRSLWPKGEHHAEVNVDDDDFENKDRKAVEQLLTLALKNMEFEKNGIQSRAFVIGRSRAYFRAGALEFLEGERLKYLGKWAMEIQRIARGFYARAVYHKIQKMILCVQTLGRMRIARRKYTNLRNAAVRVQCKYRVLTAARTIVHLRRMFKSTKIQIRWRIFVNRRRLKACISASVVIQQMVRGALQRPKYRQALIDKKEEAKMENQLKALQRRLEEAEAHRHEVVRLAEERAAATIKTYEDAQAAKEEERKKAALEMEEREQKAALEMEEREHAAEEEEKKEAADAAARAEEEKKRLEQEEIEKAKQQTILDKEEEQKRLSAEQQTLMDESGQMLEFLRKEVFKLRGQNSQMKNDFDLLKDNNQRLMDANASAGASFAALNQHAKQLSKQNEKLQTDVTSFKSHSQKLTMLQVELKEELKMKQATYVAEVHSRLQYQQSLQRITDLVQDKCRDHRLVEGVLEIADECEMDYMTDSVGQPEAPGSSNGNSSNLGDPKSTGIFGYLPFFSSPSPKP
jgi:myosin-5